MKQADYPFDSWQEYFLVMKDSYIGNTLANYPNYYVKVETEGDLAIIDEMITRNLHDQIYALDLFIKCLVSISTYQDSILKTLEKFKRFGPPNLKPIFEGVYDVEDDMVVYLFRGKLIDAIAEAGWTQAIISYTDWKSVESIDDYSDLILDGNKPNLGILKSRSKFLMNL